MKQSLNSILIEISAFMVIFFSDIKAALLAVGFLVMSDTFTGIWASYNANGIKSITSRKAGRIIAKLILYPVAIIVAKVAEEYLTPSIPFVDVTAGIIATIEFKSIMENISLILGYDLWQRIKKQMWKEKVD